MRHLHVEWGVDRVLRGEGGWPWPEASLRGHLAGCEACRSYYDQGVLLLRTARGVTEAPGVGELERIIRRAEQAALELPAPPHRWMRARWALTGAAAAAVVLGVWLFSGAPPVGLVVSAARLVVDGDQAAVGTRILEGQDVVASEGSAVVRLHGGRVVLIQDGSRLRFDAGGARATVESGAGYFRVDKGVVRFEVVAGAATVVVKGTEFLVERKDLTTTNVVVDEGLVEVRTRTGSAQVGAGQQTSVSGESIAVTTEIDLLERFRRGLQQLRKELNRGLRK